MARVFLENELQKALSNCLSLIRTAIKDITMGENAIRQAILANMTPAVINALGEETYQAAGNKIYEAREQLMYTIPGDGDCGYVAPAIAAIGSPIEFTRVHVDAIAAGDAGYISAYNYYNVALSMSPWSEFADGDKVLLEVINPVIGTPGNLVGIQGSIMEIAVGGLVQVGGIWRMQFTTPFCYYDGENLITHIETDEGGESETCIIRLVDR